jgi:hypothetical protein
MLQNRRAHRLCGRPEFGRGNVSRQAAQSGPEGPGTKRVFASMPNPLQRRDAPARSFLRTLCRHPSHSAVCRRFRATVRHSRPHSRRVVQGSVDRRPCRSLRSSNQRISGGNRSAVTVHHEGDPSRVADRSPSTLWEHARGRSFADWRPTTCSWDAASEEGPDKRARV